MLSHSNSLGNNAEKDTAGCRASDRKYIVIGYHKTLVIVNIDTAPTKSWEQCFFCQEGVVSYDHMIVIPAQNKPKIKSQEVNLHERIHLQVLR